MCSQRCSEAEAAGSLTAVPGRGLSWIGTQAPSQLPRVSVIWGSRGSPYHSRAPVKPEDGLVLCVASALTDGYSSGEQEPSLPPFAPLWLNLRQCHRERPQLTGWAYEGKTLIPGLFPPSSFICSIPILVCLYFMAFSPFFLFLDGYF